MTTIGSSTSSIPFVDRTTQIRQNVESYNRQEGVPARTIEEETARFEELDSIKLKIAQGYQNFLDGKATYLGSSRGNKNFWDPSGHQKAIEAARGARYEHYMNIHGPVTIEAIDVESAITAQGNLTGGDLKNLSTYADYLRNEVAAADRPPLSGPR